MTNDPRRSNRTLQAALGAVAGQAPEGAAWTEEQARLSFSDLVDKARSDGPQFIERDGERIAVVVAVEKARPAYERKGSLAEFLLASPLRGSDIDLERSTDQPRDIDL